ncbi:MAG: hypothetical protein HRT88_22305, partial [Lentisphaeraceae bacterium]|nr:hypothetical protein [Lentisphaeraceae bacterium]
MKKILFYFTLLSLLLSAKAEVFNKSPFDISFASRSKYGAKATGEIARRYHFPADKTLDEKDWYINYRYTGNILLTPAGQWGLLLASVKDKPFLVVYETITGGLGKSAGLLKWDEIIAVNGRSLPPMESGWGSGEGPISIFGDELYRCEAKGDVMKLTVRRQGKVLDITAKVQLKEQQPEKLLALILEDIARAQAPDGSWQGDVYSKSYSGAFLALALLSGGNAEHLPMVKKTVNYLLTHDHAMEWSWMRAIATILMAEYFAASGDMEIYPHLQAWTDMLTYEYANIYGGFGHKREAAGTYGEKSFGAPAVLIHLAWSLAAECGCRIDPQLRKRSLKYIIGKANLESSHFISYRGLARKGGKTAKESYFMDQGECGFRNGALALALNLSGDEKKLKNSIIQFMKEYYKDLCYVHSLP